MSQADITALLIIDVQNDFCHGGALAVPGGDAIIAGINHIVGAFPVRVLTQDWHPAEHSSFAVNHPGAAPFESIMMAYGAQTLWPVHCLQGSPGAAFHPELDVNAADLVLRKGFRPAIDSYSAFFENDRQTPTGLEGYLRSRSVTAVHCVGLALDYCVCDSAVDAAKLGFKVSLDENLSAAIDLAGSLDAAHRRLAEHGVAIRAA